MTALWGSIAEFPPQRRSRITESVDALGIPRPGRENPLRHGDHLFNAFGSADHPLGRMA